MSMFIFLTKIKLIFMLFKTLLLRISTRRNSRRIRHEFAINNSVSLSGNPPSYVILKNQEFLKGIDV